MAYPAVSATAHELVEEIGACRFCRARIACDVFALVDVFACFIHTNAFGFPAVSAGAGVLVEAIGTCIRFVTACD